MVCLKLSQRHQVWCLMIGRLLCAIGVEKKAILLGVAHNQGRNPHIREISFPWEAALPPRETSRANTCSLFNPMISIVNSSSSFSVAAIINNVPVTFLLDTESALTILRKSIWDGCKQPDDKLEPWNQQSLVGAEGTTLRVYGSTCVQWEVDGKEFSHNVAVVDPLQQAILGLDFLKGCKIDLVSHQLTTSDGQVIVLKSQENNKKTPVLFVRVTANVKIPAYSEMEILADVGDLAQRNQTYVLEDMNIQNSDVMVAHAVIILGESIPVRVMNPTNQPVTLYRGTRIAQLAEIEEVEDIPVMVSSVQHGKVSPELEEALWLLAEKAVKAPLASEEQEKLFLLLLEYADVFCSL